MNEQKYKWLLYTITSVIVCTIGIQVYWNYKNYLSNKQQLINDVQVSLDKAVDDYYALLAERTTVDFAFDSLDHTELFKEGGKIQEIISQIEDSEKGLKALDSIDISHFEGVTVLRGKKADSIFTNINVAGTKYKHDSILKKFHSPLELEQIKMLTSKVVISIQNDTLLLEEVDSLLNLELKRKKIHVEYKLSFKDAKDSTKHFNRFKLLKLDNGNKTLKTVSKSTFLPKDSELKISFTNETQIILKRILSGILISLLLVLAVIGCLFYLLKIIKQQKQLAEVKNDLISNITHEFKTPIATIGVAIESIKDFNVIADKEKTKSYLNMSNQQLSKLNTMVEKLLETATLDSDSLELNKDNHDLIALLHQIVEKHKMQNHHKKIVFEYSNEVILANIDAFHFENALNNVLDNAIKYGGNEIIIHLTHKEPNISIHISDNGNTLTNANSDKIFEKFYRIPKGNTHDVKGFGIGLYYTKRIIEKHHGTIHLDLKNNLTTFKIMIPNA